MPKPPKIERAPLTAAEIDSAFETLAARLVLKRHIDIAGLVLALLCLVGGNILCFVLYARRTEGQFLAWIFFVPVFATWACLKGFAAFSRRVFRKGLPASSTPPFSAS